MMAESKTEATTEGGLMSNITSRRRGARSESMTAIDWTTEAKGVGHYADVNSLHLYYETYGEDPLLAGTLAASTVSGLQDGSGGRPIAATTKHFAGYSEPFNGHDRAPADMSMRYLQDTILPSYKAAVDAGSLTVMANSGAVNGVPVTASRFLLTDVLRDRWHFNGLVVSDWNDVRSLQTAYHVAADYTGAVAAAVNAGVDMAMVPPDDREFHQAAKAAVDPGAMLNPGVLVDPAG